MIYLINTKIIKSMLYRNKITYQQIYHNKKPLPTNQYNDLIQFFIY